MEAPLNWETAEETLEGTAGKRWEAAEELPEEVAGRCLKSRRPMLPSGMSKKSRGRMEGAPNHRLAGVKEQLARAKVLLEEAHAVRDYDVAFPKLIAAVYPARAALEILREAAKLGELSVSPREFDRLVDERVPRWRLIHAVRVRDFHHYGVQGGGRIMVEFQVRLPPLGQVRVSMRANPFDPQPQVRLSDPSGSYKLLLTSDVVVQDERESRAIPYWGLLREYLEQMYGLVREFESLLRTPTPTR